MRYELTDHEWAASKPMLLNKSCKIVTEVVIHILDIGPHFSNIRINLCSMRTSAGDPG